MKKQIKFKYQDTVYSIEAEKNGDVLTVVKDGQTYNVEIIPEEVKKAAPRAAAAPAAPRPAAAPSAAPVQAGAAGSLTAPMTGVIKQIKVNKGDSVSAGQLVFIMEAMKMDLEIFADKAGSVKDIFVAPDNNVKEGQALMLIG
jgi:biotin carboxyl carrier protein